MALFEKSFSILTLGAMAFALAGCPTADTGDSKGGDSDADTDADSDSDTDTDSGSNVETGQAVFAFYVAGETSGPTWNGGQFGSRWIGMYNGFSDVCDVIGDLVETGNPPAPGCPGCTWSFDLIVSGSVATGDECEDIAAFGGSPTYDGEWDGLTYSFGWADTFDFYGDGSVFVEETVTLYYKNEWIPFMFNYGDYAAIYGSAAAFEATSFRSIYYYYYL